MSISIAALYTVRTLVLICSVARCFFFFYQKYPDLGVLRKKPAKIRNYQKMKDIEGSQNLEKNHLLLEKSTFFEKKSKICVKSLGLATLLICVRDKRGTVEVRGKLIIQHKCLNYLLTMSLRSAHLL